MNERSSASQSAGTSPPPWWTGSFGPFFFASSRAFSSHSAEIFSARPGTWLLTKVCAASLSPASSRDGAPVGPRVLGDSAQPAPR